MHRRAARLFNPQPGGAQENGGMKPSAQKAQAQAFEKHISKLGYGHINQR